MYGDCVSIIYTYMKRKTKKECIRDFKNKHGKLYDYSLVKYINTNIKVDIVCKKHGIFKQTPKQHIRGDKCPKCSGRYKTTDEFIIEVKEVHGDLYDYSLVNYETAMDKVKIICKIHGVFLQPPCYHKNGNGCPGCFIKRSKTNEIFMKEAKEVHDDLYDYSLVDYKASHKKVKIICNIHGVFTQRPNDHLHKNGCPDCARRGYVPSRGGRIYYIEFISDEFTFFKIGITNGDVNTRIKRLQVDDQFITNVLLDEWFEDGNIPQKMESNILKKYKRNTFTQAKQYIKSGYSETFGYDIFDNTEDYIQTINQFQ